MIKSETFLPQQIADILRKIISDQRIADFLEPHAEPSKTSPSFYNFDTPSDRPLSFESSSPTAHLFIDVGQLTNKAQNLDEIIKGIMRMSQWSWGKDTDIHFITKISSGTITEELEGDQWSEDELLEMLTFHAKPGAEIIQQGLTGLWADRGITDSVEWLDQLRKSERSKW